MKKAASFLIVLAGILWGCLGIFVRRLNEAGISSMEIVLLRAVVTGIALGIFLLCTNRALLRIRIKDLWCFLGTGICSIVFFNGCYFRAITLMSLSAAAVLLYTAPAIVMVLSYFLFREKLTGRKVISLVLTFLGCVLVTGILSENAGLSAEGILAGLGAGLGYALYSIFGRYALEKGYHSLTITFYTFLIAAIGTLCMVKPVRIGRIVSSDLTLLALCIALGIVCTVIPYLTYTVGLRYVENGRASIMASIEPVTATVLGVVLFRERILPTEILGVLLVLGAIVLCNREGNKK